MAGRESLFQNGATWLRADFHLHTKADKEFKYDGDENSFVSAYVEALSKAGITIGVITNHNKFEADEFKALKKAARKQAIFLLPGVELSVNDGANGIHTLVVFSDEWLVNRQDYINQFLNVAFEGKTPDQYENENARSSLGLIETIKKLEGYHKDFFLILAHVEQKSGLWNELDGGRLQELGGNELFRRRALGFQKVRTHDKSDSKYRFRVKSWLDRSYPAELEGCDAKKLEDIGKGKACYLKIGAFSFDSVKFALIDFESRVKDAPPSYQHSHIRHIHFEGGTLAGQTIRFSPELNVLIGIRGSGKSSILEVLRYALDVPFGEKAGDQKYKQELVGFTLGSGGKVVIDAVDRYGQLYQIRRIWKETPNVFIDNKLQPGVSIRETVLHKPIYFGQKDLSNTGEGFEKDLVEKLLGSKLDDIRRKIAEQKNKISDVVDRLLKITNVEERIEDQTKIKQDTEHRLEFYKSHGIEEKLQKRLDFDADIRKMKEGVDLVDAFVSGLKELLAQHEDDLRNFLGYQSKHNVEAFKEFETVYAKVIQSLNSITTELLAFETSQIELVSKYQEIISIRKGLVDEFAEIERKLAEELKTSSNQNISSDEFLRLKQRLAQADQLLNAFSKQGSQKASIASLLAQELHQLNDLWHEEFLIIKTELDKVGSGNYALAISLGYKEDKSTFLNFMKTIFKGSGIREATFQGVVDQYSDFMAVYNDLENAKKLFGSNHKLMA